MDKIFAPENRGTLLTVLVAALGYFVDVFDLLLFSIVRIQSLKDLGVAEEDLLHIGVNMINTQMAGLLVGGLLWGVIGDKWGRLSVLFSSIALYSIANIANGFVQTVEQYAVLRFISGVGLAGELGVGVTLASEIMPRHLRGLGTTFIATIGVLGATAAATVADMTDWRTAYIIGGVMGIALLILRLNVKESLLFTKTAKTKETAARGNLLLFFRDRALLQKYLLIILIGAPIWAVVGIFITFTPEFAKSMNLTITPTAGNAVLYCYIGLALGDCFSGLLSQRLQSRRKSVAISLSLLVLATSLFLFTQTDSLAYYYATCVFLGFAAGYWAMFVQMGAEQFGTNIRATAATSIPNMVRGLTIPMAFCFRQAIPSLGVIHSGLTVVFLTILIAAFSLWRIRETFHVDLDYTDGK